MLTVYDTSWNMLTDFNFHIIHMINRKIHIKKSDWLVLFTVENTLDLLFQATIKEQFKLINLVRSVKNMEFTAM